MCTNCRWIFNKYIHRSVYVPCGKCESCIQAKADARTRRIKNNTQVGYLNLFVTLTYDPDSLPYFHKSDLLEGKSIIPVYRNCKKRYVRRNSYYATRLVKISGVYNIGNITLPDNYYNENEITSTDVYSLPKPHGSSGDVVGLCFYKDIQDFEKRLYINLKRKYNVQVNYSFYQCTEYGSTYYRPHSHIILSVPADKVSEFTSAIVESWPFALRDVTRGNIEVARDAAAYVAGYVNRDADFPKILETSSFRQKHSYSQGFGKGLRCFSLPEILEKTERRDLSYLVERSDGFGHKENVSVLIPKYVINRYFPQFVGYSRIAPDSLADVLFDPAKLVGYRIPRYDESLGVTYDMAVATFISLSNAYKRCLDCFQLASPNVDIVYSYHDYILDYIRVWNAYYSTQYRLFLQEYEKSGLWTEAYDNIVMFLDNKICSDNLSEFFKDTLFEEINANKFASRVVMSRNLRNKYERMKKRRKVTNRIMTELGQYV